jgi:hypothetical protein
MATPTQLPGGVQLGFPEFGDDIRAQFTATQCEPFLIYYNTSRGAITPVVVGSPEMRDDLIFFPIPAANVTNGYLEWICDIPAGYSFILSRFSDRYYVVRPGSTSSCLQDVTATHQYAHYVTTAFQSYTAHPPNTTTPSLGISATFVYILIFKSCKGSFFVSGSYSFPTGSLPTITVRYKIFL